MDPNIVDPNIEEQLDLAQLIIQDAYSEKIDPVAVRLAELVIALHKQQEKDQ